MKPAPVTNAVEVAVDGYVVDSEPAITPEDDEGDFWQEPRTEIEILEALERLFDQIWYDSHRGIRARIQAGRRENPPEAVWNISLETAARIEEKYRDHPKALGPWSEYEWGRLHGRMAALRWVLGDELEEWDSLDA